MMIWLMSYFLPFYDLTIYALNGRNEKVWRVLGTFGSHKTWETQISQKEETDVILQLFSWEKFKTYLNADKIEKII